MTRFKGYWNLDVKMSDYLAIKTKYWNNKLNFIFWWTIHNLLFLYICKKKKKELTHMGIFNDSY